MKPLSLTARISLYFTATACLVMLVTGYFLSQAVDQHFKEGDRHELNGKLELIQNLFQQANSPEAFNRLPLQLHDALVGHHGLVVAIIDSSGLPWFVTPDAPSLALIQQACQTPPASCNGKTLLHWKQAETRYRGLAQSLASGDQSYIVSVGLNIEHHDHFMNRFLAMLGLAIALAALATAGLGWLVTRWGLAPLRQVTHTISGISAEHLNDRLPLDPLPTELQPLATAFNAMLARLDDSFRRLTEFSSNIAHELRTPISNLMTQTQVALSSARDKDAYKEILYSSLEEYERMAQMVSDMLYLAQTDNGLLKPGMAQVDLAAETQGLFDYFEAWAEERSVSLKLTGTATAPGDRLMLRLALSNLISNAIRHTSPGQTVHVSLNQGGNQAAVTVDNPGPDIPPEHLPRLFDRFYRVDPSRQRKGDGAGLGLAIVQAIVEAHNGSINVTSANQITRFQIQLTTLTD